MATRRFGLRSLLVAEREYQPRCMQPQVFLPCMAINCKCILVARGTYVEGREVDGRSITATCFQVLDDRPSFDASAFV